MDSDDHKNNPGLVVESQKIQHNTLVAARHEIKTTEQNWSIFAAYFFTAIVLGLILVKSLIRSK